MEKHLNPENESRVRGCGFVMVDCKYKCGDRFQKRLVKKHETENCGNRPTHETPVDMAATVQKLSVELQHFKTESRKEILALQNEVFELQLENCELKRQIRLHPLPSVPPFYFTMNNCKHYKESEFEFHSAPFYSHLGGYKLRVEIHANGLNRGRHSHLSLFFSNVIGEYDDRLMWPVQAKVAVEMYNWCMQEYSEIHLSMIRLNLKHRPVDHEDLGIGGMARFVSCQQLQEYFLTGDAIRFKVTRFQLI